MRWLKEGQKQENGDIMIVGEPSILHSAAGHYVGQLYLHFYKDIKRVFGLVKDFGTSQSPKSTRPLTTYL
ncbi:hypothetical protein, partial [Thiolapillus sp.]